jgi:gamma-glutamylputrescine oxidase
MADYPPSYYTATLINNICWPVLSGRNETDVCIVGGGLAGVATALGLAERGHSVTLLEGHRIGWGASGRNGGFVSAGYPVPMTELMTKLGRVPALTLWQLSIEAVANVRWHAERLGPQVLVGAGALVLSNGGVSRYAWRVCRSHE